jgi:hypothetical protein
MFLIVNRRDENGWGHDRLSSGTAPQWWRDGPSFEMPRARVTRPRPKLRSKSDFAVAVGTPVDLTPVPRQNVVHLQNE